jgi:hypothetical protein
MVIEKKIKLVSCQSLRGTVHLLTNKYYNQLLAKQGTIMCFQFFLKLNENSIFKPLNPHFSF